MRLLDSLSGCNAYVVIDWGELGQLSTPTAGNTVNPIYNTTLHFLKEPIADISNKLSYPALDVYVYHRNISISDELIGRGHLSTMKILSGFHKVRLYEESGDDAGELLIEILL